MKNGRKQVTNALTAASARNACEACGTAPTALEGNSLLTALTLSVFVRVGFVRLVMTNRPSGRCVDLAAPGHMSRDRPDDRGFDAALGVACGDRMPTH